MTPFDKVLKPPDEVTLEGHHTEVGVIRRLYFKAGSLDRFGFGMPRLGLVVVLCWIGGLKTTNYEAKSIVPFVANSPLMSYFYHHPAPEYRQQNPAGGLNIASHEWNETNGTYAFSYGLGCVIVGLGLLIALQPLLPQVEPRAARRTGKGGWDRHYCRPTPTSFSLLEKVEACQRDNRVSTFILVRLRAFYSDFQVAFRI